MNIPASYGNANQLFGHEDVYVVAGMICSLELWVQMGIRSRTDAVNSKRRLAS